MRLDLFDASEQHPIVVHEPASGARDVARVTREVAALPARARISLLGTEALTPPQASALFRALGEQRRPFRTRLGLAAVEHKTVVEEAARAGCVAIEIQREGALIGGLATGIHDRAAFERAVAALRRVRGLGVASMAHLPLGLPEDDEGVFERVLRFCRRALIAVPVVSAVAIPAAGDGDDTVPRMDRESLENGVHWTRRKLARHLSIWRRSLWPGSARDVALPAGYRLRRAAALDRRGRYTARMRLLRKLNRTVRAKGRSSFLMTPSPERTPVTPATRRAWLRTKAASDARMRALLIEVEGALDLRGARALLERVGQAVQAGYQRITIDVDGVEAVSKDVVSGFLADNKARLVEVAKCTRIVNLRGVFESLRQQLDDSEDLRLIEFAART